MSNLSFKVLKKDSTGTRASRGLRNKGFIPVVLYNHQNNRQFVLLYKDFYQAYCQNIVLGRLIELFDNKETYYAIVKEIQLHPVSSKPVHVDFLLVKTHASLQIAIRIKILNTDKAPGLKKGGVLNLVNKQVKVLCLPENIPPYIEVDVQGLNIGDNIKVQDIKVPVGTKIISQKKIILLTITGRVEDKEILEHKDNEDNIKH